MAKRSLLLLSALFLLLLSACSVSDEVIPSAQASETMQPLYPALAPDAEADGSVHEYH